MLAGRPRIRELIDRSFTKIPKMGLFGLALVLSSYLDMLPATHLNCLTGPFLEVYCPGLSMVGKPVTYSCSRKANSLEAKGLYSRW